MSGLNVSLWWRPVLFMSGIVLFVTFARAQEVDPPRPVPIDSEPTEHAALQFHSLSSRIKEAESSYRPLFIVYPGKLAEPGDDSQWKKIEEQLLASSKKQLKKFLSVEIQKPSSKEVIELFGGVTKPLIAFCDFRGVVLKRWDGPLPTRSSFRKFVKRAWEHNAALAGKFDQARKAIGKARYALKTKKYKEATQLYLRTEQLDLPADSAPAKSLAALRKEFDEKIEERKKAAGKKEKDKDYHAAIDILEKAMADFPIPDVRDELRKKITRLYSKLRGYG